ncbi:MAG: beta-lactamase family protein [Desulfobacteraceae bacterium]|nr:beta-lactamase family protein [Desulfobacteraceae bacterium]
MNKAIDRIIKRFFGSQKTPGMIVTAVKDSRIIYEGTMGETCLKTGIPVDPQTAFHMASVTKLFVGTAVVQLWEKGLLALDQPVVGYLPRFRLKDPRHTKITSAHILSHTSGMPDFDSDPWSEPSYDDHALARFVTTFVAGKHLTGDPGQAYQYCNTLYEVLGDLVAVVSGQLFEDYVQDHILLPLGMNHSTLYKTRIPARRLAMPHVVDGDQVSESPVFPYNRMHAPSSTMYSTVGDMGRWLLANLNRGCLDGVRILKSDSFDRLWQPVNEKIPTIGLSWHRRRFKETPCVYHGGSDVGFRSYLALLPQRNAGVFAAANAIPCAVEDLVEELLEVLAT